MGVIVIQTTAPAFLASSQGNWKVLLIGHAYHSREMKLNTDSHFFFSPEILYKWQTLFFCLCYLILKWKDNTADFLRHLKTSQYLHSLKRVLQKCIFRSTLNFGFLNLEGLDMDPKGCPSCCNKNPWESIRTLLLKVWIWHLPFYAVFRNFTSGGPLRVACPVAIIVQLSLSVPELDICKVLRKEDRLREASDIHANWRTKLLSSLKKQNL